LLRCWGSHLSIYYNRMTSNRIIYSAQKCSYHFSIRADGDWTSLRNVSTFNRYTAV